MKALLPSKSSSSHCAPYPTLVWLLTHSIPSAARVWCCGWGQSQTATQPLHRFQNLANHQIWASRPHTITHRALKSSQSIWPSQGRDYYLCFEMWIGCFVNAAVTSVMFITWAKQPEESNWATAKQHVGERRINDDGVSQTGMVVVLSLGSPKIMGAHVFHWGFLSVQFWWSTIYFPYRN